VFYLLLQIIRSKGKYLLIDEIDAGIHFSRMKEFLKNIILLANKNDVQLFFTTHSLECQESFIELFDEPDMVNLSNEVRQFSLYETIEGVVMASKRSFDQLHTALEIGFETRGGNGGD
jgi:AAA15 family ATPase/GTPase